MRNEKKTNKQACVFQVTLLFERLHVPPKCVVNICVRLCECVRLCVLAARAFIDVCSGV